MLLKQSVKKKRSTLTPATELRVRPLCFPPSAGDLGGRGRVSERLSSFKARSAEPSGPSESSASRRAELEGLEGSAQAALARLAEEKQV